MGGVLTGDRRHVVAVKKAARAYRVYYHKTNEEHGDYLVDHSIISYMIDPNGDFLTFFGKVTALLCSFLYEVPVHGPFSWHLCYAHAHMRPYQCYSNDTADWHTKSRWSRCYGAGDIGTDRGHALSGVAEQHGRGHRRGYQEERHDLAQVEPQLAAGRNDKDDSAVDRGETGPHEGRSRVGEGTRWHEVDSSSPFKERARQDCLTCRDLKAPALFRESQTQRPVAFKWHVSP